MAQFVALGYVEDMSDDDAADAIEKATLQRLSNLSQVYLSIREFEKLDCPSFLSLARAKVNVEDADNIFLLKPLDDFFCGLELFKLLDCHFSESLVTEPLTTIMLLSKHQMQHVFVANCASDSSKEVDFARIAGTNLV